jgi:hypothetical protein
MLWGERRARGSGRRPGGRGPGRGGAPDGEREVVQLVGMMDGLNRYRFQKEPQLRVALESARHVVSGPQAAKEEVPDVLFASFQRDAADEVMQHPAHHLQNRGKV